MLSPTITKDRPQPPVPDTRVVVLQPCVIIRVVLGKDGVRPTASLQLLVRNVEIHGVVGLEVDRIWPREIYIKTKDENCGLFLAKTCNNQPPVDVHGEPVVGVDVAAQSGF